jgi:hypothetical protein
MASTLGFNALFRRSVKQGVAETFGWSYKKGVSQGFLGIKGARAAQKVAIAAGKRAPGIAGTVFGHTFGAGVGAFFIYNAYRREGLGGAVKEAATFSAINAGLSFAGGVLTNPFVLAGAAVAATGYAGYQLGEFSRQKHKQMRELELGGGAVAGAINNSIGIATARQRSMMALQNTHLNYRSAIGNEAVLYHIPMR